MPWDHRAEVTGHGVARLDRVLERSLGVLTCVSATNARRVDFEDDLIRTWSGVWPTVYADVGSAIVNGCLHFVSLRRTPARNWCRVVTLATCVLEFTRAPCRPFAVSNAQV